MNDRNCQNSFIHILPSSNESIFCFFYFSPSFLHEFELNHGMTSWENAKTLLSLYQIDNGIGNLIKIIYTDGLADNWYIKLDYFNTDVYVEIGKQLSQTEYVSLLVSNTLTISNNSHSPHSPICFASLDQSFLSEDFLLEVKASNHLYNKNDLLQLDRMIKKSNSNLPSSY